MEKLIDQNAERATQEGAASTSKSTRLLLSDKAEYKAWNESIL